jgi:hypothetical protein
LLDYEIKAKLIGKDGFINDFYYQEHEIVYILESDFHRPFVLQEQDSLKTQRSLSRIFFMENREMPILHKPLAFGKRSFQPG